MTWVKDFEGMIDFLSQVIVHAPDNFPKEDYLDEDEQLTLELRFLNYAKVSNWLQQDLPTGAYLPT